MKSVVQNESALKIVRERIESYRESIAIATEYLESGKYADWSGFRPLFVGKMKNGKFLPPHKDWVKNVFLRNVNKLMRRAEKKFEILDEKGRISKR